MDNKKINTEPLDIFFSFVSKAVIIIPIVVIIISLFLKFNTPKKSISNSVCTGQACLTPTLMQNNSFKFDLNGPLVCDNLFIKDKKVLLKNESDNYLLNGDCFYNWETGRLTGEKKCGLINYVKMAENYLGFLDINSIVDNNIVRDFVRGKNINVRKILDSCRKKEIKDSSIFKIPEKILFNDKK